MMTAAKYPATTRWDQQFVLLLSLLLREFTAVTVLLILQSRVSGYDMFNTPMIMFIVLILVRVPYLNTYVYLFEKFTNNFGARSLENETIFTWMYEAVVVLGSHVAAAATAAAMRVYFNVNFGVELQSASGPNLRYGLSTDVNALREYGSYWRAGARHDCFVGKGLNGTVTKWFPLAHADQDYCLFESGIAVWYFFEEMVYVATLCVCYVHIWLFTGVGGDNEVGLASKPVNPFSRPYWLRLFKLSFVLCFLNAAMARGFPTAHGSLHNTLFYFFVDEWSPQAKLIDRDHDEILVRVIGGLVGALVGWAYGQLVHRTRDTVASSDSGNLLFCFVWGFEPQAASVPSSSAVVASATAPQAASAYQQQAAARGYRVGAEQRPGPDFKLRIPYSLM